MAKKNAAAETETKTKGGKAAEAKAEKAKTPRGPTWSIGLFRNPKTGRLSTVYVNSQGTPMPYETTRVGGQPILIQGKYTGMLYSEARQKLLAEAKKKGIKDEPVEKPAKESKAKAEKSSTSKPKAAAKATEAKQGKAARVPRRKAAAEAEVQEQSASSASVEVTGPAVDVEVQAGEPESVAATA